MWGTADRWTVMGGSNHRHISGACYTQWAQQQEMIPDSIPLNFFNATHNVMGSYICETCVLYLQKVPFDAVEAFLRSERTFLSTTVNKTLKKLTRIIILEHGSCPLLLVWLHSGGTLRQELIKVKKVLTAVTTKVNQIKKALTEPFVQEALTIIMSNRMA